MTDNELKEYIESANAYVKDLKDHPEKRMDNIQTNDEIVFLKRDTEIKDAWNFGYAQVISVETDEGLQKNICKINNVKAILIKSPSYPFNARVNPEHILRNYTDEKRREESNS